MRCKQCNHKMRVLKGAYAVCLRGCGRVVSFRTGAIIPGDPMLAGVPA